MTSPLATPDCPDVPDAPADHPCNECTTGQSLVTQGLCCRDFRSTLGQFATGVTVLTALSPDGEPVGITISSFNSVSLDPPLILWSLAVSSPSLDIFRNASNYAVNILAADQRTLSDRFASRSGDRFSGVRWRRGLGGVPLLDGCCAWFECTNEAHYPGGDHLIFVGRVEQFDTGEAKAPLVFYGARYRRLDTGHVTD